MRKRSRTQSSRPGSGAGVHDSHHGDQGDHVAIKTSDEAIGQDRQPADSQTEGVCVHCRRTIGRFYNLFHKVSGTYYLPAMLGSWESFLRPNIGRPPKHAAQDSPFEGCLIRQLLCPGCPNRLGFHVLDAPATKSAFLGRDCFKLSDIELQCIVGGQRQVVEPRVDSSPLSESPLEKESSPSASLLETPAPVSTSTTRDPLNTVTPSEAGTTPAHPNQMETEARPMEAPHEHHSHHHYHHHQPLKQVEPNRQPLPSSGRSPGGAPLSHGMPQKSPSHLSHPTHPMPSPPSLPRPAHDAHFPRPPSRDRTASATNGLREPTVTPTSAEQHRPSLPNGRYTPRSPQEGHLDPIARLQTQISQNSGALCLQQREMQALQRDMQSFGEASGHIDHVLKQQSADIARVEQTVGRLQYDLHGFVDSLKALQHEVQILRSAPPGAPASTAAQDAALELMASQIAGATQKANEVDNLKVAVEIMKRRIARLEGTENQSPAPPASQAIAPYHAASPHLAHINNSVPPLHRTSSLPSQNSLPPIHKEEPEAETPVQTQGGWVAVNSGMKRQPTHEALTPDSNKRPKLAPIEPRAAYASSQPHQQHSYEHVSNEEHDARMQTHSHSFPPHPQSHHVEHVLPSSHPPSAHASPHMQHAAYPPYPGTQGTPDDAWRVEAPRVVETRTPSRGRPRGGGPGSRGGRGRKSQAIPMTVETSDWSREGQWQGLPESDSSPSAYYHVAKNGIIRRGSGGGGPSRNSSRAVSLGMQGVTPGVAVGMHTDPYAHTKKTRTKPTRNADGVLIRKDGRPDMRSQSSAANLRKVHARKEEQKERDQTPTSLGRSVGMGPETPSPTSPSAAGRNLTDSAFQRKHTSVMKKMFPSGVDESRREMDYARKAFEEDKEHVAHPRNQHHHESRQQHVEQHASSQSQMNKGTNPQTQPVEHGDRNGDVSMQDAEQTEEEGRTTRAQSDTSAPYPDSAGHEESAPSVQQEKTAWPERPTEGASGAEVKDQGAEPAIVSKDQEAGS